MTLQANHDREDNKFDYIPHEWFLLTLGKTGKVVTGTTPDTKRVTEYYDGEYKFIRPGDMGELPYIQTTEKSLTESGISACRELPSESVLVVCIGATIGKVGMTSDGRSATNQQINAVICNQLTDPHYLYYTLLYYSGYIRSLASGNTVPILNKANFSAIILPFAPLPEQRRIATVLNAIQEAIAAQEDLIAAARAFKRSLMARLFTYGPGRTPAVTKETAIGEIPAHWEVVKLGECIDIVSGQVDPRVSPYREMMHIGPENIESQTGRILSPQTAEELKLKSGKYLFSEEHVLYSKIRPYLMKVMLPSFTGICSADMYPIKPDTNILERDFLYHFLLTEVFTSQAVPHQERTGIPKINRSQLNSIIIPLPPTLSEQHDVYDMLNTADEKIAAEEDRKAALQAFFQSMLHQLMMGQVRLVGEGVGLAFPEGAVDPSST